MTTIIQARPSLSSNDAAVLQALFDAEPQSTGIIIDPSLPPWPEKVNISSSVLASLKKSETEIILKLHNEPPSLETFNSTIREFDSIIDQYPTYPSAYTNRAQVLRMLIDFQYNQSETGVSEASEALFVPKAIDLSTQILSDLGQAINIATSTSPEDSVSAAQARLLADAHTHRGYLLLKAAREKKNEPGNLTFCTEHLRNFGADQLEEMASQDFFFGGKYGNKVAQQLAVQTNPYAKMCGAIVKEAMKKETEG
ncbi:hypothetical protein N7495_003326 [Penicillium taxi]|uniref:uncharacterized protein n=1 Tax=Penicillium taxi TaxID=168475 RepID=UPI0025453BB3|nr:uncharacterized protein N7495_003326 [Penicillium taxi]KAJ5902798.1 hypothetical protein N7495_003326 [Penicillium taxi]